MRKRLTLITICLILLVMPLPRDAQAQNDNRKAQFESYTFEREIRLAPGEFYAVTYDDERKEFIETEPDRQYQCLDDRALKQILRAPMWLREKFADRMVDLLFDEINVGGDAVPIFSDVNSDGLDDLVVGNAKGEYVCYPAPYFKKDDSISEDDIPKELLAKINDDSYLEIIGKGFRLVGADDGSITATSITAVDNQLIENLNRIKTSGKSRPVFADVTSDKLPDLLIGSSDGTISVYKNYGTQDKWWFVTYTPATERIFDYDVGFLSSPSICDVSGDGINDIISGAKNTDTIVVYLGPDYNEQNNIILRGVFSNNAIDAIKPALGDLNSDGINDLLTGHADGECTVYIANADGVINNKQTPDVEIKVAGFASPCIGDFDGDSFNDIVVGASDNKLHLFKSSKAGYKEVEGFFDDVDCGEYPSPAAYDFNNDNITDLIVGNKSGGIKAFIAPDWEEVESGLGLPPIGSFSSPTFGDLTGDGVPELLIGALDGTFHYYEGKSSTWEERYSWKFHQAIGINKIEDYFKRTHPESTLLRGANDDAALNAFLDVLEDCGDDYFDEAVFAIANTQTEFLRVMARLDNADIVFENAKAIYDFASKVKYANIKEKEDYTTIEYVSEDGSLKEIPRDIYYWWVVHPIVEYEIPARIDASYFRHDAEYYGISEDEWKRKQISFDEYQHTPNAHFWRTFLIKDRRYGKNILDVVENAENIKEAAYLIADWITFAGPRPDLWNEYGRQSTDFQPLVIYEKNYGSCGEQAMLCVAYSRCALIPNAPVGCHGEDHAWNEFWMDGKWYKWDLGNSIMGIGHPWNERRGHTGTQLLSVIRHRSDGLSESSSTRPENPPGSNYNSNNAPGYTEVGRVRIRVVDEINVPIEGALVVARSKWNNFNRASVWDYTDPEGYCYFELGNPATGSCIIDVITPLGATGTECFVVRENEDFEYTYKVPGLFNKQAIGYKPDLLNRTGRGFVDVSISVIEEEQRPHLYAGGKYGISEDDDFREKTGYKGTRWYSEPNKYKYGVYSTKLTKKEYEKFLITHELSSAARLNNSGYSGNLNEDIYLFYNANRYTHVRFKAAFKVNIKKETPVIKLASAHKKAITGEKVLFAGTASDNLHVASIKVSINGGVDYTDITNCYDRNTGEFKYTWDTGDGGPLPAGEYKIIFSVEDGSAGFAQTEPVILNLEPTMNFTDQVIYQDNPDDPLPVSSWMLGPFTVDERERFIGIEGTSEDPGFDMDLFLFHDENGNRILDGNSERIKESTSSSATESIIVNDPEPGAYWIYCQGWKVKDREDIDAWEGIRNLSPGELLAMQAPDAEKITTYALLDVALSFDYKPAFIVDINPTSELPIDNPVITGKFEDGFDVNNSSFKVTLKDEDITDSTSIEDNQFTIDLSGISLNIGEEYPLRITARTKNGLYDKLDLTLIPTIPEVVDIKHAVDEDGENLSVDVALIREDIKLDKVRARINERSWVKFRLSDDLLSAIGNIPLNKLESGEHKLVVEYRITEGKAKTREIEFKYKKKDETLIKVMPSNGAKVFDHRTVIVAYYALEIKDDVIETILILDGDDVSDSAIIYSDGIIYFPLDVLSKGDHEFVVVVKLKDRSVIETKSTFTILSMDDEEEEKKE